ncbi:MAG: NACHT domain-containing protein, partial [Sciscionella sp.]
VDGVDELTQHRRDGVRTWLRGMLGAYPNIRVVVTSRPTAVTPKWLTSEEFRSVVLEPMMTTDVKVFLQRWHEALLDSTHDPALLPCPADEVPEHERALLGQLQSRPYLRALARSPLLCAMLCALNLDRKAQLPRDRLALYAAALDMLLERRDASRNVPAGAEVRITGSEKQTLLRELAWWLTENGRTQLGRDQAHTRIEYRLRGMSNVGEDADTLLRHLLERGGVIRQPVQGKVDFVHRTFQEFLAAKEAIDRDSIDLLISNSRSDLWRETILMACAHASYQQRGRLLKGILDKADTAGGKAARQLRLLAAACKENATEAPPEILDKVHDSVRSLAPPRNLRESRSLATVGETVLDYLPTDLHALTEAQAAACVRTAALVNGPRALKLLGRYSVDNRARVQEELVDSWRYFDPKGYAETVLADAPLTTNMPFGVPIDFVEAIPFLKIIHNLRNCNVTLYGYGNIESEVLELSELRRLESLAVYGDVAPASMAHLSGLQELEMLVLSFTSGWPGRVDFLADMTNLRRIFLINVDSMNDFTFLGHLQNLTGLHLNGSAVRLSSWVDEVACPNKLKYLEVTVLEEGIALRRVATRFPNLHYIHLFQGSESTNLKPLESLPLSVIGLHKFSAVDTKALASMPSLRILELSNIGEPVDLTPLANSTITILLRMEVRLQGTEALGSGVTIKGYSI